MALIERLTDQTGRFGALLLAMLLDLVLAPIVIASPLGYGGERFLAALVLVAALVAVRSRPVAIGLFVLSGGATILEVAVRGPGVHPVASVLRFIFLAYVFALVVRRVLTERDVTYDTIAGAACAYVLLGLVFGQLFIIVEQLIPGSFDIPASFKAGPEGDVRASLIYFSLSTLTTVGYGDIHPAQAGIGALAVTEAIVGQL